MSLQYCPSTTGWKQLLRSVLILYTYRATIPTECQEGNMLPQRPQGFDALGCFSCERRKSVRALGKFRKHVNRVFRIAKSQNLKDFFRFGWKWRCHLFFPFCWWLRMDENGDCSRIQSRKNMGYCADAIELIPYRLGIRMSAILQKVNYFSMTT